MTKFKFSFIVVAATLFTLIASFVASSACIWGFYQPKEPKSLNQ